MTAKHFYLAICRDCGHTVIPFAGPSSRDDWAEQHADSSGHIVTYEEQVVRVSE